MLISNDQRSMAFYNLEKFFSGFRTLYATLNFEINYYISKGNRISDYHSKHQTINIELQRRWIVYLSFVIIVILFPLARNNEG